MDTQKNIDEHMLLDYFSGSLSATQKQEVEEWLNQSEENRKIARDIQYIYLATDTLQTIKGINSDQALVQVNIIGKTKCERYKKRNAIIRV